MAGRRIQVMLIVLVLAVTLSAFGLLWPTGSDWFYVFYPTARSWLAGETHLYDAGASQGFYLMPWGILVLAPLAAIGLRWGQAVLAMLTLCSLVLAVFATDAKVKPWIVLLAVANLHTFDALIRGNVDALPLLGLALGWLGLQKRKPFVLGVGLWLLAIKPINVALPVLVLLYGMRRWTKREIIKALLPMSATFILSFAVCGLDWPVRYTAMMKANPPLIYLQTSLWRALVAVGLPRWCAHLVAVPACGLALWQLWRHGVTLPILALAITTNLLFTPYALGSHYVLLAIPFVILASCYKVTVLTWLLTFTPLLRLRFGFDIACLDVCYPLALWLSVVLLGAGLVRQDGLSRQ